MMVSSQCVSLQSNPVEWRRRHEASPGHVVST
jgi:hypothetical protein